MTTEEQRFHDFAAKALFWAGALVGVTIGIFGTALIFIALDALVRQ